MKATQAMREAFGKAVWASYPDTIRVELEPEEIDAGIQAVLDLIEHDPCHQVYYRALLPDGRVWGESSAERDFPIKNAPDALTYQKIEIDTMTAGWQEWTP